MSRVERRRRLGVILTSLMLLGSGPVAAAQITPETGYDVVRNPGNPNGITRRWTRTGGGINPRGGFGAPEVNPAMLASGVLLLVGGTLILAGRRRKRHATG